MERQLVLLLLATVCLRIASSSESYIVVAPKTVRPGATVKISVTTFRAISDVDVRAEVVARGVVRASARKTVAPNAADFIELQMPEQLPTENGEYSLVVAGSGGLTFRNETTLTVDQKCVSVFIQTDKGIYKPGQTVMMRFVAYKPTLLPYSGKIEVSISDSSKNLMAKWKDVQLVNGVASSDFPLSIEPPVGVWTISVSGDCLTGTQTFQVDKYVLPKFEVTVTPPPFIVSNDDFIEGTITAKYTYGQPVKGNLVLTYYIPTQYAHARPKTLQISRLNIDGTYAFRLYSSQIRNLQDDYYIEHSDSLPTWGQLAINASVTETLTGVTLSGQGLTHFKPSSIKIKFHDSTPNTFKPGLTFVAKIIVTTQDNKPVDRASVTVIPNVNTDSVSSVFEVVGGIAEFTYVVPSSTTYLSLEAVCVDSRTGKQVRAYHHPAIAKSPSNSFIQLSTRMSNAPIGAMLEYKVASNFQFSLVRYQVLARGGIVTQGAQQLDTLATRISLNIDVTHDMAPTAQIIAYVIKSDGEVVADSLSVSVSNAFENAVDVSFGVSEKKPGENVALTVTATPDSFVAVAAVDYSVTLLADTNDITQADVIDELQSYDTSTPDWDDSPVWAFRRKRRSSIWWPWSPGGQDAYQIFDNAGVVVLTDTTVYKDEHLHRYFGGGCADCGDLVAIQSKERDGESPPAAGELLEPERVRTFFPETWLWTDAVTGPDGTAVFASKVPDTITTWVASAFAVNNVTGLGVPANTAELRAFQPFFVSLNLPYSVRRGEQLGLKVTVFNYQNFTIKDVVVELEENDDLLPVSYDVFTNEVEPVNSPEHFGLSQRVTVTGNNGTTVVFAVKPRTVGRILIRVKATSRVAADAVERQLLVVPEGRAVDYTHNVFIQLDESDSSQTQSLALTLPSDVVADSGKAIVSIIGDLMGPTLNNLERLVRMPYGCGEQNAASTAPNIFVREYLDATGQLTFDLKEKTNKYMTTGYQRELNYKHNDGSYSAWGGEDDRGSLWLTAFVMKLYSLASYYVTIDPNQVETSTHWIARQQLPSGSFPVVGKLHSSYISGGLDGVTANTAFVLISLFEARKAFPVAVPSSVSSAITKAQDHLERKLLTASDSYTICIMSYALALTGSSMTTEAIKKLNSIAITDGKLKHWSNAEVSANSDDFFYYPYHARSAEIEMTGYALLAITNTGDISGALPVARWLSKQRNSLGGWSSTQDTCVALQALSAYASALRRGSGTLDILLTSDVENDFSHSVRVDNDNALVLQQAEVPVGGDLHMRVNGSGTALLQATVSYNVPAHSSSVPAYQLIVDVTEKNGGNTIVITLCSTYKKTGDSGMVVVSSILPSGFGVDNSAMDMYLNLDRDVKRYDVSDNQVDLYLNQLVYNSRKCVQVTANREYDVGNVQPVPAEVYSYYEPDLDKESVLYAPSSMVGLTVCELCLCNEYCAGCGNYNKTIGCPKYEFTGSGTPAIMSYSLGVITLTAFMSWLLS